MEEIPMTELGFVDIKKYVYDSMINYVPLLQKGVQKVIIRKFESVAKEPRPFITFSSSGGFVDNGFGIRTEFFEFEVYAESFENGEEIRDIIVDLFNRRNFKGIKSKVTRTGPDGSNDKTGFSRHLIEIDFVFKDMKY